MRDAPLRGCAGRRARRRGSRDHWRTLTSRSWRKWTALWPPDLLSHKSAGWTHEQPPWPVPALQPGHPPRPPEASSACCSPETSVTPSTPLTDDACRAAHSHGRATEGRPPPVPRDSLITEEPQFFNGPGGWRQCSSLSSLVQAHSPVRDLAHGWAVGWEASGGPHGPRQALHLMCCVSQTRPSPSTCRSSCCTLRRFERMTPGQHLLGVDD